MGGSGSGQWRSFDAKTTVEDCLTLDCGKLQRKKIIREGIHISGSIAWTHSYNREAVLSSDFTPNTLDRDEAWLELNAPFEVPLSSTERAWLAIEARDARERLRRWWRFW